MTVYAPSGTYATRAEAMATSLLASGEETIPRHEAATNSSLTLINQSLRMTFWTARKTEPITQVRVPSGTPAAGATPTLCRVGIYSVDGAGAGTLVASIPSDTTLWATSNTDYLRSLSQTFNKVANQLYAFAWLCVTAAAAPGIPGLNILGGVATGNNASGRAPRLGASLAGQADLPANFTDVALNGIGGMLYAELVP